MGSHSFQPLPPPTRPMAPYLGHMCGVLDGALQYGTNTSHICVSRPESCDIDILKKQDFPIISSFCYPTFATDNHT